MKCVRGGNVWGICLEGGESSMPLPGDKAEASRVGEDGSEEHIPYSYPCMTIVLTTTFYYLLFTLLVLILQ